MSWTTTDLATLEAAIASGARRVSFADGSVEYNGLDSMLRARHLIRVSLGLVPADKTHYTKFRKGPRPGQYPGPGRHRTGF